MLSNSRTLLFFRILALSTSAIKSSALSINVTVDDQFGDEVTGAMPTYSPLSIWNQGANCSHCKAKPDPSLAFNNTWHDTTAEPGDSFPTVEISFTGTAVYAFFILGNNIPGALASLTNLTFNLDGNDGGTFLHNPTSSSDFIFKALGFHQESLENNQHTLIISDVGTPNGSLILFDFLIYTVEEEDVTTTQTSTNPSKKNAHTTTSTITSLVTSPVGTTSTKPFSTSTSEQSSIEPGSSESNTPNESLATPPSTVLETVLQTHPQTETTRSPPVTSLTNTPSGITGNHPGSTDSQSASHQATRNVGAIVGGLLGAIAAVILTILVFLCCRRRRREREASWIASQFVVSSRHSLAPTIVQASPQTRESGNIDFLYLTPDRTNTLTSLRPTLGSNVGQPQIRIGEQFEVSPQRADPSPLNGADRGRREDSLGMTDTAMHFDNEKSNGSNGDLQSSTGTDDVHTAPLNRFPGHRETRLESTPSADRNDVVLLNQIATLQAEVDRLQSFRQSVVDSGILISTSGANQSDEPPPGYYGERDEASVPRQL